MAHRHLDPTRARMLGRLSARRRWAKYVTPADRAAQTANAREAQRLRYVARAIAEAEARGQSLTTDQADEAGRQLRLADLAAWRLKAWDARKAAQR